MTRMRQTESDRDDIGEWLWPSNAKEEYKLRTVLQKLCIKRLITLAPAICFTAFDIS